MSTAMQNTRTRNRNRQPVSGRGGYPSYKRESSESEPSNSSPIRGLYKDQRTAMMLCSFMGTRTSVKTRNGSTYKGHTIGFSHMGDIALTDAKLEDDDSNQNPSLPGLIIRKDTFVVCKTNGVDLKGLCTSSVDFTDSGIVGRLNGSSDTPMRELQPWDDEGAPDVNSTISLDDPNDGWDSHSMFQANRDKFDVQTTYSDDLHEYTTKLPDPGSAGYEERQKLAQKYAEEIEQSEAYQKRIAKELGNGDEESQYSAVHRSGDASAAHRPSESNNGSAKNAYTIPALRADSDQGIKNGTLRGQGRGVRHNSPYSPTPQQQQQHHHQLVQHNAKQINNHYQGPPPSGGPLSRNQGPGPIQSRQHGPQNHAVPQYPHHQQQYQQQPPPPHPGMHHHQPPVSQHQPPISQHQSQHQPPLSQHQPPLSQHQPPIPHQSQHQPPISQHQSQHQPPISHQSQHQPPISQHQSQHQPPISQHQSQHQPPIAQHQSQHQPPLSQHQPPISQHQSQHQPPISQHQSQHQPPISQHQSQHQPPISQHQPPIAHQSQHQPPISQHQPPISQHQSQHQPPISQHQPPLAHQPQHQPLVSQHQPPVPQQPHQRLPLQQLINPGSQNPKPLQPHPHPQSLPTTLPSLSQQPPPPLQHTQRVSPPQPPQRVSPPHPQVPLQHTQRVSPPQPPQRVSPPHPQVPLQHPPATTKAANINGPSQANLPYRQVSTEGKTSTDAMSQKLPPVDASQQVYHQKPSGHQTGPHNLSASSSSSSLAESQQIGQPGTSPPSALVPDRVRGGHSVDTGPEERNKIDQSLHDFKRNFVLESNGANPQDSTRPVESSASVSSATPSSSVPSTPVTTEPEQLTEQAVDGPNRRADRSEEEPQLAQKFQLNPNAKEFKPKTQSSSMEAQSPSPQPRSSPHMPPQMVHYPPQQTVLMPYQYIMTNPLNPQRKRATVSLGAGVVSDLTAHQVTGQPLLATQPPGMMYIQTPNQPLPAGYQIINQRMVAPGSLTMAQAGLEQAAAQNQPQPVFMTAQQSVPTPMPAHLHHQPTHAHAMPHPSSNQSAHVPNPAPSPVQQHNSQPQHHPHHMQQAPSQSATPQPAHYPQMTLNYTHNIPTVPRTSISGQQQNMPAGHSTMSFMSGPQFAYNGNAAQYAFAPAPQTPQSSSHGSGPQTHQYVVMPQPNPQGHPSMQQHTAQPYTTANMPYQSQHLMQGPPQMPPSHNQNPNQGSPHMIHPGMPAGMHQQVSSGQPGMYMQMPSTIQYHQQ